MAYDGASNQLVLFGGQSAGRPLSDTWSWDGHGWTHLDVAGPSARYGASLAYDSARQVLVLVGGFGSTWLSDTWEWDGSHWSQLSPPIHPKPRAFAEMAFDQRTGRMVLVGGQSTITYVSTWTWDGSNWTLQNARTNPPGRHQGGIAYDAARGAVVLYGGSLPGIRRSDCWTWNGSGWTSGGAGPAAGWTGLAWDGAANELIGLVAQNLDSASSTNALITGHAGAWSEASAAAAPPYRSGASVAYDDSVGRVVVFGGVLASGADTDETWLTDGNSWNQASG